MHAHTYLALVWELHSTGIKHIIRQINTIKPIIYIQERLIHDVWFYMYVHARDI